MINPVPNTSYDTLHAQPLCDIIFPPIHPTISPHKPQSENMTEITTEKIIKKRRIFSWSNILLGLALLFFLSTAAYFYWPQNHSQSTITHIANSLYDISKQQTPGGSITHDPNDSGTGSTGSNGKSASSRNDKPNRSNRPISKSDKVFNTIIGGGSPGGDDGGDDDDPNRRNSNGEGDPDIYSDVDEESQEESLVDDEDEEEDDKDEFWMTPPESANLPNLSASMP